MPRNSVRISPPPKPLRGGVCNHRRESTSEALFVEKTREVVIMGGVYPWQQEDEAAAAGARGGGADDDDASGAAVRRALCAELLLLSASGALREASSIQRQFLLSGYM